MKQSVAVINGPNLNLLGSREPEVYGTTTLEQIRVTLENLARNEGVDLSFFQSNSEGALVDEIQRAVQVGSSIIINPGAYTHTSVAIRDALVCSKQPIIEVHLSNLFARESFRQHSFVSDIATGVICGLGPDGYELALRALITKHCSKT